MAGRSILRFLFIVYCVDAGIVLLMVPWSPYWDHQLIALPLAALDSAALQPWVEGAVSGFGLFHLVWAAHDFDAWLLSRRRRQP